MPFMAKRFCFCLSGFVSESLERREQSIILLEGACRQHSYLYTALSLLARLPVNMFLGVNTYEIPSHGKWNS
jgi:hypothetical protein